MLKAFRKIQLPVETMNHHSLRKMVNIHWLISIGYSKWWSFCYLPQSALSLLVSESNTIDCKRPLNLLIGNHLAKRFTVRFKSVRKVCKLQICTKSCAIVDRKVNILYNFSKWKLWNRSVLRNSFQINHLIHRQVNLLLMKKISIIKRFVAV